MPGDWKLLQPNWLALLPLLGIWYRLQLKQGLYWAQLIMPVRLRYPPLLLSAKKQTPATVQTTTRLQLTTLSFSLCIMALSQPVILGEALNTQDTKEPMDVVIVVGTSISMVLRDYHIEGKPVSRMQMTRQALQQYIQNFKGRRIGLVVLGNPAAIWLPLSSDRQLVLQAIKRLRPTLGGRLSDLGGTLNLVAKNFADEKQETTVLLLSDGGLQLGALSPQQGARALRNAGLTLHSIAIGKGRQTQAREPGELIHSPVDINLMQDIAELGGGQLFQVNSIEAMQKAMQQSSQGNTAKTDNNEQQRKKYAIYPWLLGIAMLLFLSQQFTFSKASQTGTQR